MATGLILEGRVEAKRGEWSKKIRNPKGEGSEIF